MTSMPATRIALARTSVLLLLGTASLGFVGCSGSEPASAGNPAAGTASVQAGSAGAAQAGTTGTAGGGASSGGSNTTAGSATGGINSSGGASGAAGSAGSSGAGGASVDPSKLDKFSFFVTSMAALIKLSKSDKGFGGDLRYGTGDGLMGADKICTEIAETSMPGSGAKQWHAFLSTTKVNAKDRIGTGPWYDRTGKLVAQDMTGLLKNRPDADAAIKEDLPNENGFGNHRPNPNGPEDDNHHTLTGSNAQGTLDAPTSTCLDWTTSDTKNDVTGRPRTGFSWSVQNRTAWIFGQLEGGCGAGITGVNSENGPSDPSNPIVGSGGGYGGFYCFALTP
jgi:hypothetical protein